MVPRPCDLRAAIGAAEGGEGYGGIHMPPAVRAADYGLPSSKAFKIASPVNHVNAERKTPVASRIRML